MTRTVLVLIALYFVWRLATIMGRVREREYRARQRRLGVKSLVRCARCGAYVAEDAVRWSGVWPIRRAVCANGCAPSGAGDGPVA